MNLPEAPPGASAPRRGDPLGPGAGRRRAAMAVGLTGLLAVVVSIGALHQWLMSLSGVLEGAMRSAPVAGAALFLLLSAVSAMLAFFSSGAVVPAAVATYGVPLTGLMLWIGWTLGGLGAWSLGRWLGRPALRASHADSWLARIEQHLGPDTPVSFVVLLQVALPSELPGYLLGIVRYPPLRYVLALGLVELPFAFGTVLLGQGFLSRQAGVLLGLGLTAAAASLVAVRLLRLRLTHGPPAPPGPPEDVQPPAEARGWPVTP